MPRGVCNGFQSVSPGSTQYLYTFDCEWAPGMAGAAVNPLDPGARHRLAAARRRRRSRGRSRPRTAGCRRSPRSCARRPPSPSRNTERDGRPPTLPTSTSSTARSTPATRTPRTHGCARTRRCTSTPRTACGASRATRRCSATSKDPSTFSNAGGIRPDAGPLPMMIDMDDPEHWKRRKLVNRGLHARAGCATARTTIRDKCDAIIDRCASRASATSSATSPRRSRWC